ncbi:SDR family NAD(P)-dependent oxidoreductase [Sphingobium sp. V4]|uniref:SDR family NAD(P)-dependent oxidoreductase n=1 Tax=Sphingobium sp. V4 TaxID=3038927 RepID=UPI002557F4C8|nr:SDR family NAD(P)-dependent oxidoreductase [Sphingobium sp. V4]WIW89448.1 SDR family NAD(P)-dependent oxidoreductase [Sphingobium sp. V4]
MTEQYGSNSTTDDVLAGIDLRGKRALVTGVSSGLGVETARSLVAHGADVIGAARDIAKAKQATDAVRSAADASGGKFELVSLDLADLSSVHACAGGLLATGLPFDIIIANAGVMAPPLVRTVDGFESQFATNYLGHFALVNRVAPLLREGARVVILSSAAHQLADVDMDDPNFQRTGYDPWIAYGRSKTAAALFAVEFDRRHRERGVRAVAVHPGAIQTGLQQFTDPAAEQGIIDSINAANAAAGLPPFRYKTVPEGAASSVWAAARADAEAVGGHYCEDCQLAEIDDSEGVHGGVKSYALDSQHARAVWTRTEKLLNEHY